MQFNHDKFIEECGGDKLRPSQKEGLLTLITFFESDPKMVDLRWIAYGFATVDRECAGTWEPIEEYGKGKGMPYGKPHPKTGLCYYGRGYTQNTWYANYLILTEAWNKKHPQIPVDFVKHPELLCIPEYAYWAMSYGMRNGAYTGVGLSKYINAEKCDYRNARRIINGTDHAHEIENAAIWFEGVLKSCEVKDGTEKV